MWPIKTSALHLARLFTQSRKFRACACVLSNDFERVRNLPIVLDYVLTAERGHAARVLKAQAPAHHVDVVYAVIGKLPARIVIKPAEFVIRPVLVVTHLRGRTEPAVPFL